MAQITPVFPTGMPPAFNIAGLAVHAVHNGQIRALKQFARGLLHLWGVGDFIIAGVHKNGIVGANPVGKRAAGMIGRYGRNRDPIGGMHLVTGFKAVPHNVSGKVAERYGEHAVGKVIVQHVLKPGGNIDVGCPAGGMQGRKEPQPLDVVCVPVRNKKMAGAAFRQIFASLPQACTSIKKDKRPVVGAQFNA